MTTEYSQAATERTWPSPCGHGELSTEQRDIVELVLGSIGRVPREEPEVIEIGSKAGTGKTSTGASTICASRLRGYETLTCSFTVNGVKEFASALSRNHGFELSKSTRSQVCGKGFLVTTFDTLIHGQLVKAGVVGAGEFVASKDFHVEKLIGMGRALTGAGIELGLWSELSMRSSLERIVDLIGRDQQLAPDVKELIGPFWEELRELARFERLLLVDDLSRLSLEHAPLLAKSATDETDLLVADEAQDCSRREIAFLKEAASHVTVAMFGDPGQQIMGFRGAVGRVATALRSLDVAVTGLSLTVNRRSTAAIVDASNELQLASGWTGPLAVPSPAAGLGLAPLVVLASDESLAVDALMVGLGGLDLAPFDQDGCHRLGGEKLAALWAQSDYVHTKVRESGHKRAEVEVLVARRKVGRQLEQALAERGVTARFVVAAPNPFEGPTSLMLRS